MLLKTVNTLNNMKLPTSLMKNVLVTGGNTITPYFNNLVSQEFAKFSQESKLDFEISNAHQDIASKTSWIGGAVLGSLIDFDSFYITKA